MAKAVSMHVVANTANTCNLAAELNKPLIHQDNSSKKNKLTFKRSFLVLKLAKKSAVIHLRLDSVLAR